MKQLLHPNFRDLLNRNFNGFGTKKGNFLAASPENNSFRGPHTWPRVEIKGGDEFSKKFLTPGGSKGRDDF